MNEAAVLRMLAQDDPEARRRGVQLLGELSRDDAGTWLLRALGDDDWRVRKEAAAIARKLEHRADVIPPLVAALAEETNIGLRNGAVEALIGIGGEVVAHVLATIGELTADGRKLAVEVLGGIPDIRCVAVLGWTLADRDPNVRAAAAEALGRAAWVSDEAREQAIRALSPHATSTDPFTRHGALDALSKLRAELPWDVFANDGGDPLVRRYAVRAAATSSDPRAMVVLRRALLDRSLPFVTEAVLAVAERLTSNRSDPQTLRAVLRAPSDAFARIRELSREGDARVRGAALLTLGVVGGEDDVSLLAAAGSDPEVGERAERALRMLGPEAVPALVALCPGCDAARRAQLISLVSSLSPQDDRVRALLRDALDERSPDVVSAALRGLATAGEGAPDMRRVAAHTQHENAWIASTAASTLASLARRCPSDALALLDDADPLGGSGVIGCIVLGAVGQGGNAAHLTFLDRALAQGDTRTRRFAIEALARLGGDVAQRSIAFALADEERDVQLTAIRALGAIGRGKPLVALVEAARDAELVAAALKALSGADPERTAELSRPLVRHPDAALAAAAVEALGQLSEPWHRSALFDALEHPSSSVVRLALSEIVAVIDAASLPRVGGCLNHPDADVRRLAAELLGQCEMNGAHDFLRDHFENETNTSVKLAITTALREGMGGGGT